MKNNRETQQGGAQVLGLDRRQLLVRHTGGDADAFPELIQLYRSSVYSYLRRAGLDQSTSDDMFQEIFLKIHRAANSYDAKRPLTPWIFAVVANTVRSHYRKYQPQTFSIDAAESVPAAEPDGQLNMQALETARWLEAALQRLPYQQREAMLLQLTKGLELQDIAGILGIPVNSVKTLVRRARIALAQQFSVRERVQKREVST